MLKKIKNFFMKKKDAKKNKTEDTLNLRNQVATVSFPGGNIVKIPIKNEMVDYFLDKKTYDTRGAERDAFTFDNFLGSVINLLNENNNGRSSVDILCDGQNLNFSISANSKINSGSVNLSVSINTDSEEGVSINIENMKDNETAGMASLTINGEKPADGDVVGFKNGNFALIKNNNGGTVGGQTSVYQIVGYGSVYNGDYFSIDCTNFNSTRFVPKENSYLSNANSQNPQFVGANSTTTLSSGAAIALNEKYSCNILRLTSGGCVIRAIIG